MDAIDAAVKHVTLTISTNAKTNLKTTTWNVIGGQQYMLDEVSILFAIGHAALTGVRLRYNGAAILPWAQPTAFIVGDNERLRFPLGIYLQAPILVDTQNTDTVVHQHVLTARLVPVPTGATVTPVSFPLISA